ncbi:hypothetical protein LPW11_05870 [Geomonas sp. RF6]|uniref:hypothetical protein n=1 Tax=Geomonas sp. RF6 TaxID=2897342 RepID=UPI001E59FB7D|nr:hypothetical protein [Geomonas sp. RF6]UFS71718.1 hypothetical protein LPW11_05870 [Geomonas sp. RF6]
MKRVVLAAVLIAAMVQGAVADSGASVQLDETFTKARTWLDQQSLALTGGPSGQDYAMPFEQDAILFYGEAVGNPEARTPAQRELGAKRTAEVMAQRSVLEYLNGFAVVGDTLVKDSMQQYDVVRSAVAGTVKGAQVVYKEYSPEKDMAVAIVKLGMHGPKGFATSIYEKIFRDPQLKKKLTELNDKPALRYRHKAENLPELYDGLVVDATEQNFKPALINRIFSSKGELLYDPSKVSQKILVDQGCGEYTSSVEKAKEALSGRGVKNPLVVKATGSLNNADLQLAEGDAVKVYSANQKNDFFAGARVAFVLK